MKVRFLRSGHWALVSTIKELLTMFSRYSVRNSAADSKTIVPSSLSTGMAP